MPGQPTPSTNVAPTGGALPADADGWVGAVRTALGRLHDTAYLQSHALASGAGARPGRSANPGAALRDALLDAIEGLRPPAGGPGGGPGWRVHQCLVLRYVDG